MILVISSPDDDHASAVIAALARCQVPTLLLNLSDFPQRIGLTMRYDHGGNRDFRLKLDGKGDLPLRQCQAIWWRRPQPFEIHPQLENPIHRMFAYNESREAFTGLWQTMDVFWVNNPVRDEIASHKPYQLRAAHEVGLEIPATLITNNPEDARAFINERGPHNTIYKSFLATEQAWRETRLLRPDEVALLDNVRYAPLIFQEYIPAQVDLRVTVVGEQIFVSAIHSQEISYKVDYRTELNNARFEAIQVPAPVEEKLHRLMNHLGLVYGAIDMRLTPDGRYIFLEINTSGQWLFVEKRTGQPITETLAQLLVAPRR